MIQNKSSMSLSPTLDINASSEKQKLEIIHGIYLNTISRQMADSLQFAEKEFRKPNDSAAYRVAAQYVCDYLAKNYMANSAIACEKETGGYLRTRHEPNWILRRLRLDDTKNPMQQLLDLYDPDFPTHTTETGSPKRKTTITNTDMPTDAQFVDSQNFSQFTGILTTAAGAEFTVGQDQQTMNTFTQLSPETKIETTSYDPRGVKKAHKPKPVPQLPQDRIQHSHFKAREITDTMTTVIDTIADKNDYIAHKNARKQLREGGFITNPETTTMEFNSNNEPYTTTYLEPKPRYVEEPVSQTWYDLEDEPNDLSYLRSKSRFADSYQEMSKRKRSIKKQSEAKLEPAPPIDPNILQSLNNDN